MKDNLDTKVCHDDTHKNKLKKMLFLFIVFSVIAATLCFFKHNNQFCSLLNIIINN